MKTIILTSLLLLTSAANAIGCQCSGLKPIEKRFAEAPFVLIGTLIGDVLLEEGLVRKQTFSVSETFKGEEKKEIIIYNQRNEGACGFGFSEGEKYLIFTVGRTEFPQTGSCIGNQLISSATEDDLLILRILSNRTITSNQSSHTTPISAPRQSPSMDSALAKKRPTCH